MTSRQGGLLRAAALLALALVACQRDAAPSGPPVPVRFVHRLTDARIRMDLKARPQLTVRYRAAGGEYERGVEAASGTFTYSADGGAPAEQAHAVTLPAGRYHVEACLEAPGGTGCKDRPADYLASADLSGNTRLTVPAGGGAVVVHWGMLNPSMPDAAPPDAGPVDASAPRDGAPAVKKPARPPKPRK
jgi:hypothetical protein